MRIDGIDAVINRLGAGVAQAVARAQTITAQIWSDYQQRTFDRSLMTYQSLVEGKKACPLKALRGRSEQKRDNWHA